MPTVSSGTVGRNCLSSSSDPLLMEEWSLVVTVACDLLLGTVTFLLGVSFSMQGWKQEDGLTSVVVILVPLTTDCNAFRHTVLIRRCAWVSMWCGGGFGNCLAVGCQAVTEPPTAPHVGNYNNSNYKTWDFKL